MMQHYGSVLRAIPQLRGAYGTVIMDTRDPGTLLAARSGSPLVIGLGMETLVATAFSQLLGCEVNDIDADFFALGGHS
ncbi:hypothetical protein FK513_28695, partial [Klebsiella pneumoniae]|nr:hypothetical protein [Klebsiella pneumoniae]